MKNLLKLTAFAMLFGMGTFITSCGSDDSDDGYCYECNIGGQELTLCEGDEVPGSTPWTQAELDAYAEAANLASAGSCEKK